MQRTILGIDPGRKTGYAVLQERTDNIPMLLDAGVINPPTKYDYDTVIFNNGLNIRDLIIAHRVDTVLIESGFFGSNIGTTAKMAELRGAYKFASRCEGCKVSDINPTTVKKQLCNDGKADKDQVMAALSGKVDGMPTPEHGNDMSDAIAIAYCATIQH
jgi:crossover junction endodeoxyribonuclease RuvC